MSEPEHSKPDGLYSDWKKVKRNNRVCILHLANYGKEIMLLNISIN